MDMISVLITYAVGTLFGMVIGAKWGFERGVLYGVSNTIDQLDKLNMLNESPTEIVTKIQKIQQHQDNQ